MTQKTDDLDVSATQEVQESGDITSPVGDITSPVGDITSPVGDITSPVGNITPESGNITPESGDITPKSGDITQEVTMKTLETDEKPAKIPENSIKTTGETPPKAPIELVSEPVNKIQQHFVPPVKPIVSNSRIVEGRRGVERVPFDAVKDDK